MTSPAPPTDPSLPPTSGPIDGGPIDGGPIDGPFAGTAGSPAGDRVSRQTKPRWKGDFESDPKPSATAAGAAGDTADASFLNLPNRKRSWLAADGIPSWLISTIVHALFLVAMLFISFRDSQSSSDWMLGRLSSPHADVISFEQLPVEATDPAAEADSLSSEQSSSDQASAVTANTAAVGVASPLADDAAVLQQDLSPLGDAASGGLWALPLATGGLYARDAKSRAELGQKYGATAQSEEAVEAALRWLAAHQQRDGSWSFDLSQEPCNDQCRHSAKEADTSRPATAATGLALLAFLGAGYTHHEGKYADEIRRGLYFLRERAAPASTGLDLQSGSMYGHGIAMMAIGEAMGMTRYQGKTDSDLFSLADAGSSFTMNAQHELGGWRYIAGSPGDVTVTAWQVMSLISAKHGGVALRTTTLPRAERFVRSLVKGDPYQFAYQPSTKPEPTPTAIGLCLLLYFGQSPQHTHFARGLDKLVQDGPRHTNVYHSYYATLALHLARHHQWAAWHVPLRDRLVQTQATEGHEAGSWHFRDQHGDLGGRLYTTAMAAMILEVYYRYLPLYNSQTEFRLD